jgi:hypothetical protein
MALGQQSLGGGGCGDAQSPPYSSASASAAFLFQPTTANGQLLTTTEYPTNGCASSYGPMASIQQAYAAAGLLFVKNKFQI